MAAPNTPTPTQPTGNSWSVTVWVWILSGTLVALATIYVCLHTAPRNQQRSMEHCCHRGSDQAYGRDRVFLTEQDRKLLNALIDAGEMLRNCDTTSGEVSKCPPLFSANKKAGAVADYLSLRLRTWELEDQRTQLALLDSLPDAEVKLYFEHATFTVYSYFWLTGWQALAEVAFWTLFGVLCSLLYSIYEIRRTYAAALDADPSAPDDDPINRGFDPAEMQNHLAKAVFAPFVSLILILGYNYFADGKGVDALETSTGVVVMSFLLGFYSSRAMSLLARIRDVLLPVSGSSTSANQPPPSPAPTAPDAPPVETLLTLALASTVTAAHPDQVEELNNALDKATVTFTLKGSTTPLTAARAGNDQDSLFSLKAAPGLYHVLAVVTSAVGINLKGELDLDLSTQRTATLLMTEEVGHG